MLNEQELITWLSEHCPDECVQAVKELIERQAAQIEMAREALKTFIDEHEECEDAGGWMAFMCSPEAYHTADETLETLSDPAAILAERDARQWQPIETAPKDGKPFFAYRSHTPWPLLAVWNSEYAWVEDYISAEHLYGLTHWMPLPNPPESGKDK